MLKANSKKVNDYFKSVIIQSFEVEDLDNYIKQYNDLAMTDYNFQYDNIIEYIICDHAGHGLLTPYYSEMRKDLKMALEETDEEAKKFDDFEVAHLYYSLLYRALFDVFEIGCATALNRANKRVIVYFWKC